jgi:hypothetical protein
LRYHLSWLEHTWQSARLNEPELLIDIAKWLVLSTSFLDQKVVVLEWLVRKSCMVQVVFERMKQAVFMGWFQESSSIETVVVGLVMLRHFLEKDSRMAVEMLGYLLEWRGTEEQRLRNIFQQAHKLTYLKYNVRVCRFEAILSNRLVPESLQTLFYGIVQ